MNIQCLRKTLLGFVVVLGSSQAASAAAPSRWVDYLDFAYVYSSADAAALTERLDGYANEAGLSLDDYILETYEIPSEGTLEEGGIRRKAIAYFLRYLANRDLEALDESVEAIETFKNQLGRHENLYWYRYIMAHRSLENGNPGSFTRHLLDLWLEVVSPLESSYETLSALSLSQSPNSGFVSALPYVYENIARLVMVRSQERGLSRDLDPLAATIRMLHDSRVGAHPDVIPLAASAKPYLDRIVDRLDGSDSDGGSLTFTLALFEATRHHETARSMLATEGLSRETVKAMGIASGAYQTALSRAETPQGEAAVYVRVLRQIGEIYAAKQRLQVDPYVESPFTIDDATDVYRKLYNARNRDEWVELGFRITGRKAYTETLQSLWEEIQEASLNAADYYLARSQNEPGNRDEHVRSAARIYASYLSFFEELAQQDGVTLIPDSAYFAAYEAAKGYGDALLSFGSGNVTRAEIDMVTARYSTAQRIYPFDRRVWSSLAAALERQGRSNEFLGRVRPVADAVTRSRHISTWIDNGEASSQQIAAIRRAMMDDLVIMYLGFAEAATMDELEAGLHDLETKRRDLSSKAAGLSARRGELDRSLDTSSGSPAKIAPGAPARRDLTMERSTAIARIAELERLVAKLDKQIEGRRTAIPLYGAIFASDDLIPALRAQREHPVHALLRRMFHEQEE
ncbi:MAG: hypothetical protein GY733_00245 [bacterium]|nr:hypothetical protein [bacterium]